MQVGWELSFLWSPSERECHCEVAVQQGQRHRELIVRSLNALQSGTQRGSSSAPGFSEGLGMTWSDLSRVGWDGEGRGWVGDPSGWEGGRWGGGGEGS